MNYGISVVSTLPEELILFFTNHPERKELLDDIGWLISFKRDTFCLGEMPENSFCGHPGQQQRGCQIGLS